MMFGSAERALIYKLTNFKCQSCGNKLRRFDRNLWGVELEPSYYKIWGSPPHIHHIDGNQQNNDPDNLILVCPSCHRNLHKKNSVKKTELKNIYDSIEKEILLTLKTCAQYIENGKISTEVISKKFNNNRIQKEKLSRKSIGWMLKKLGFRGTRMSDGCRGWFWNERHLAFCLNHFEGNF